MKARASGPFLFGVESAETGAVVAGTGAHQIPERSVERRDRVVADCEGDLGHWCVADGKKLDRSGQADAAQCFAPGHAELSRKTAGQGTWRLSGIGGDLFEGRLACGVRLGQLHGANEPG